VISTHTLEGLLTMFMKVVQTELTKIAILKANILQMDLAFKDLTILAMESILDDLKGWHSQLPQPMRIENLRNEDISAEERRSIHHHVHLLYLGSIMLLYRRIASQFVRSYGLESERTLASDRFNDPAFEHANQGLVAAKQSARILHVLLSEDGVFRRCWLVM
jgi:hypothetical protein